MEEEPDFDIKEYFPILEKEIRAFGLNVKLNHYRLKPVGSFCC